MASVVLLLLALAGACARAQVALTAPAGMSQTFDALASTGAAGTLTPWSDNAVLPGWYAYKSRVMTGSPIGPPVGYFVDDGSWSTGGDGLRSYGTLGAGQTNPSTDRALGELSSTDSLLVYSFGVRLVNATGAPITNVFVTCRGEEWRQNTSPRGFVAEYQVGASSLSSGTWTRAAELDFLPPKTGAAGALDGNAPGNFKTLAAVLPIPLAPAQELWLRWTKQGVTSCGLAIDDLAIVPAPGAQPTQLNFSHISSTAATLSFAPSVSAVSGYLVLRKIGSAPATLPVSGRMYAQGDTLGSAIVVASGNAIMYADRGLTPASRYYYIVFAYTGSGASTHYLLSDAPAGMIETPAALSSLQSDVVAVSGSESSTISSLVTNAPPLSSSSGKQVWMFSVRDGGLSGDADTKPTVIKGLTLRPGPSSHKEDWTRVIRSADLFDGETRVGSGTVTAAGIEFHALDVRVSDDGVRTLALRISLTTSGLVDHAPLQFALGSADLVTESDSTSSQLLPGVAIASDASRNLIDVAATRLHFFTEPADAAVGMAMAPAVVVEAVDANTNRDTDFSSQIEISATGADLASSPVAISAIAGAARFAGLTFTTPGSAVTLTAIAAAQGWSVTSAKFRVPAYRAFYVDANTGSDLSSGLSPESAWKTLSKVNATVFEAGDTIRFRSGARWSGQLKPLGSGTALKPIVVSSYGGSAKPVIDGAGVTGEAAVYLNNQSYWEITDLEITNNASAAGDRRGILVSASNYGTVNHVYLKNLFIHNIKGIIGGDNEAKRTAAIGFEVAADQVVPTRFNDIWIDSCTIAYVDNVGIYTDNLTVRNDYPNTAGWNARKVTNLKITRNVLHHISKNAMIIRLSQGGLVEHNVCYETATGTTGNTMFTTSCDGTVFQYNEAYLNRAEEQGGDFGDGSMYDADLQSINCVFQYSYSHDNSHGLFWTCTTQQDTGNVCRYNVSRNDHGIIFCINYPVTSISVYNNTVYCGSSSLSPTFIAERNMNAGTRKYTFANNIICNLSANAQPYLLRQSGYTRVIDHNVFYGFHPANEPADAHKITDDPGFVDAQPASIFGWSSALGFALKKTSAAIDRGAVLAGQPVKDYQGGAVPSRAGGSIDCGAFEYQEPTSAVLPGARMVPNQFRLEQNFPNPFNPSTEIRYSIPAAGHVTLSVYNVLGQRVAPLVDAVQAAGEHVVAFDAGGLSSGVYIYTLRAGASSESKRLVVEK